MTRTSEVGIDCGDQRRATCHQLLPFLRVQPLFPIFQPGLIVGAGVEVDIKLPVDSVHPIAFKCVQFLDGDCAYFRPRSILKCVVVEKLAAKEQGHGKVAPHLPIRELAVLTHTLHDVDPLSKVVHAQ